MKTFITKTTVTFFLLAAAFLLAPPAIAQAQPSSVRLTVGRTYTQYDITGDKKPDRLRITAARSNPYCYNAYHVYINGKKVLSKEHTYVLNFDIRRLELKNGKVYLALVPGIDNGDSPGAAIYQYKNKRLQKAIALDTMSKIGNHNNIEDIRVSGNKIRVKHGVMSCSLGSVGFWLDHQYKNGRFLQKAAETKLTHTMLPYTGKTHWTANRSMKISKTPGGRQTATLKKGQKVKIDQIYLNAKHTKIYLHVKIKGGRSGWIKGLTSFPSPTGNTLFQEVQYAG